MKLRSLFWDLMKVNWIRYYVCYVRWLFLRKNLKIHQGHGEEVAKTAISYNLTAFDNPQAAFGMGRRMSLVIFPMAAILRNNPDAKVLIIGPRTEDDVFWAISLGLRNSKGFDLFSYSDFIIVGDMHQTQLPSHSYDAVIFGWVLAYSTQPEIAIQECKRVLKPGGYLAVGMESLAPNIFESQRHLRNNNFNTLAQLDEMVKEEIVFHHDPDKSVTREVAGIYRLKS